MKLRIDNSAIFRCIIVIGMGLFATACGSEKPSIETQDTQLPIVSNSNNGESSSGYPSPANAYPGAEQAFQEVPADISGITFDIPLEGIPTFPGKLAFHTERYGGNLQIAIVDGATGEVSQFTQSSGQAFEPSWSPDCSSIVFSQGTIGGSDFGVYRQDIGGSQFMSPLVETDVYDWAPAWSPTDDVIAYQSNRDALVNICFTDPTGRGDLGCMERGSFSNAMPAWSPDGTQLAFGSNREGNWELYVTDYPDMQTLQRLTNNTEIDFSPQFSPDGQTLLFSSQRLGTYNLYTIDLNSGGENQLTFGTFDERTPAWLSNDLIAYSAFIGDDWEIYLIDSGGNNIQRLTYSKGIDQWPAWCSGP